MKLALALVGLGIGIATPALADTPTPTKDQALAALTAWVDAQNHGDFASYTRLYDPRFVGIKRTSDGGSTRFTLGKWKADRKKMFKNPQKVAADAPSVVIKDGKVTIDFVQRYQSGRYADHGDKELVLVAGAGGALAIAREEMLYSAPGWTADPAAELDLGALASPITLTVRQQGQPEDVGGCGGVTYTLELVDAKHAKKEVDIGSGFVSIDKATEETAASTGDKLFEFGEWCAGGADFYQIVRNGDALVVRHKAEDEGSPDEPAPPPTWETELTIKLASGARTN
jgi:hypothetical protein